MNMTAQKRIKFKMEIDEHMRIRRYQNMFNSANQKNPKMSNGKRKQ
jgi:hypothetical protein